MKALSVEDYRKMFCNDVPDPATMSVKCDKCEGWAMRSDLKPFFDVEDFHPLNRHLHKRDLAEHGHITKFEQCPHCGRNLYADGRVIGKLEVTW